jgi:hypothetical protein
LLKISTEVNVNNDLKTQLNTIDKSALATIVEEALGRSEVDIREWKVQLLHQAAVGYVFRLKGVAQTPIGSQDWSLVVKIIPSPASPHVRLNFLSDEPASAGYWKRELHFYQSELAHRLPEGLAAPRCYQVSEHEDECWLWLEDLSDVDRAWTVASLGRVARKFGHFNGCWVNDGSLANWPWLCRDYLGIVRWIIDQQLITDETWDEIEHMASENARFRQAWPQDIVAGIRTVWARREAFMAVLEQIPRILVHGDVKCDNLFVRQRAEQHDEIVAIDWGLVGLAPLGQEIAGLTMHAARQMHVPAGLLGELDEQVFGEYMQGLVDGGWKGDPRVVRLGYAARIALHFALTFTLVSNERGLLHDEKRAEFEADTGHTVEEYFHTLAVVRRFILARAEETWALKDSLALPV